MHLHTKQVKRDFRSNLIIEQLWVTYRFSKWKAAFSFCYRISTDRKNLKAWICQMVLLEYHKWQNDKLFLGRTARVPPRVLNFYCTFVKNWLTWCVRGIFPSLHTEAWLIQSLVLSTNDSDKCLLKSSTFEHAISFVSVLHFIGW